MSIYAIATGNWSNPAIWNTGVLPVAGDIVRPNNFIVTMDVNSTVTEIRNDAGGGAVIGGRFIINSGVSIITTTITVGQATTRLITHSDVGTASIAGTITNLSTNAAYVAIENASSGTLNINGNIVYTQNNTSVTIGFIQNSVDGIINITGTVNGNQSGANSATCVLNVSVGTINIIGDVISPTSLAVHTTVVNASTGTVTIIGDIITTASRTIDNRSSGTVTITGNVTSTGAGASILNSTGTITLNGNVSHTQTAQILASIIDNLGTGNITITGDISSAITTAVNAASGNLIRNNSNGTITIIGEVSLTAFANTTSNTSASILNNSTGIINITGSVIGQNRTGSFDSSGILNASTGVVNVTGNIQAGATLVTGGSYAIRNTGLGVVNVIGTVQGNGGDNRLCGIGNTGGGTVNITGNAIGGSKGLAVVNTSTGTINLNGNAVGGSAYQAIEGVNAAGNTLVEKIVFGANGQTATRGYIKFKNTVNIAAETVLLTDNSTVDLLDVAVVVGIAPDENDVRQGVNYLVNTKTGTMIVPPANAVKAGVPVDNGVGMAALTPQDVWNVFIANITTANSIGVRLKNASTVDTTGAQIAGFIV